MKTLETTPDKIVDAFFEYINLMNGPASTKLGVSEISGFGELTSSVIETENGIEFSGYRGDDPYFNRKRLERFLGDKLKKKVYTRNGMSD